MNILYCASECYPFFKSGGLGDVAYSLPKALKQEGVDARVITPKYFDIPEHFKAQMETIAEFTVPVSWRSQYVGLQHLEYDGVDFYFIDNEYYFKRPGAYGYYDDGERFAYFSRAVLEAVRHLPDFVPDVLHTNDWQTAIIPVLLKQFYGDDERLRGVKTVFTIHNLKYQGVFPKTTLNELLSLDDRYYTEDTMKFYDAISFMKAGINFSDAITTVSKTYAQEIQYEFYGEGLHGLLAQKKDRLTGILNGIDYSVYSPGVDPDIYCKYSVRTMDKKKINKQRLQEELGLEQHADLPLLSMITRLEKQKGLDLVANIFEEMLNTTDIQFAVLGTGNPGYEDMFRYFSNKYPGRVSASITFSNVLAKKIYAGSDMFLMPSLFEPCGLSQLIALKYGCIPIVRETGGLADTVTAFDEFRLTGNGFSFKNYNAGEMLNIIRYAVNIYQQPGVWMRIMMNAMKSNFSFQNSVSEYIELYQSLTA